MKIRFDVDQAESLRRGVDCPRSLVTLEIDPVKLSQEERGLIADRLDGMDVCRLGIANGTPQKLFFKQTKGDLERGIDPKPFRVQAKVHTFGSLMSAIRENEKDMRACLAKEPQKPLAGTESRAM